MTRRLNVFGQPLSYDVGVEYSNNKPIEKTKPIDLEKDDLSQPTKDTVTKYTEDLTRGNEGGPSYANEFPINSVAKKIVTLETTDGKTPEISRLTNGDNQYADPFTRRGAALHGEVSELETLEYPIEPSDISQTYRPDTSFVKKGKSGNGEVNGNNLLSDQNANVDQKVAQKYVSQTLRNNRFNSNRTMKSIIGNDKKFNPDHPEEGKGSYKKHAKLGTDLTDGHLANVGPMLTLRATKELNSVSDTGYGTGGPSGTGASASSLLPGLSQVGVARVSTDDLQVDSVLKALIAGEAQQANITEGSSGPTNVIALSTSYGQMNNVLERFSGLLPLGMIAAATALSIALNVALRAVLAVFLLITNASNSNSVKRDDIGRFIPGDSRYNPAFQKTTFPPIPLPAKLFGLQETVNPYGDAVSEGIKVFFGGKVGDSLTRIAESPGFYATFCRSIVRSAADLIRSLEGVGTGNPIQVAENIIGFVDAIKSSKVVIVMNIFAQIGDSSLSQAAKLKNLGSNSDIDNLQGLDAMRSRMPGSLKTAWGASTTRSSIVLPSSVRSAMLSSKPGLLGNFISDKSEIEIEYSKISSKQLEFIEDSLDSEYMPFYFHDLRTNEIVSFHAFLANLSEDFTANYDSLDGYGRIDSVKLYKNTQRKISVQFYVAATNNDDFDSMWLKINKLTTLVYPQWSKGTVLNASDNKFVQPFSQVPSASPLMRIRVGDLWTSNYSRFSLARIFGLGSDETFKLKEFINKNNSIDQYSNSVLTAIEKIKDNNSSLPNETIWVLEPGDYEAATKTGGPLGAALGAVTSIASSVGIGAPANTRVIARLRNYTKVAITEVVNNNVYAVKIMQDEGLSDEVKQSRFLVSKSHLSMNNDTLISMGIREPGSGLDNLSDSQKSEQITNISQFFSSENNAIVKGYEAAKGKGIAALVESLNFDWNSVPWETGKDGSRAPKMCKVTMNMAVVHDIAPGIDSEGFNRAPIYSVGKQSNAMAGKNPSENSSFSSQMNKVRKSLI